MDKQHHISDNKFYIVLAIALLALIVGATGLVISLQRAPIGSNASATNQLPLDNSGDIETTEIDPSTGSGVVESPKKN